MLNVISKLIGALFIVAAVFQWVSFDYPDTTPFWPGAVFTPGTIGQVINWLVVCILAVIGTGFWNGAKLLGRTKGRSAGE